MNLDDLDLFSRLDGENIYQEILDIPGQLEAAWELGLKCNLPDWGAISRICVAGMGTSALGAQLVAEFVSDRCPVPIVVHQDYGLPVWAGSPGTLLIIASYSGETEEMLSVLDEAIEKKCDCLVVSSGGRLTEQALHHSIPLIAYQAVTVTGSALGFAFGLILALIYRMNLIDNPSEELDAAVKTARRLQALIGKEIPAVQNPAKRLAGQMVDRWVNIYGAGLLAPVARSWKIQINELAKCGAQVETLPEANHNALVGIVQPESIGSIAFFLFLRAPCDLWPNRLRSDHTRRFFMLQGLATDFIDAWGRSRLDNMWSLLCMGDFVAYYLAMAYRTEPASNEIFSQFNSGLRPF